MLIIHEGDHKGMKFEVATSKYLDSICEITEQAKAQLRRIGIDQWQKGYPSREIWEEDIEIGRSYIFTDEGKVLGAFAYQESPDASYYEIDGKWLTDGAYASMHRVCVADACKGRGVAGRLFTYGCEKARESGFPSMRIDTHPGNIPMQKALQKAGFQQCGTIVLAEGSEKGDLRIAFEKIIKK